MPKAKKKPTKKKRVDATQKPTGNVNTRKLMKKVGAGYSRPKGR